LILKAYPVKLKAKCDNLNFIILKSRIVSQITEVMEANGIAAGNNSRTVLEQTLEKYMSKLNQVVEEKECLNTDIVAAEQRKWYIWNGSFHRLPENFSFPKYSLLTALQLWFQGNRQENLTSIQDVGIYRLKF
jgi:hypothetical protein